MDETMMNNFKIVHIKNQSSKFYLTRQALIDSALTQDIYSFFYHILSMNIDDFNRRYGSFAYLKEKDVYEATLYLNVNQDALVHIINFIQTNKYNLENDIVDEVIDLASVFGMPNLIERIIVPIATLP